MIEQGFRRGLRQAVKAIRKADSVIVASHVNPDGDTIGCMLALGLSLLALGKRVTMLSADGVPARYRELPGTELVLTETSETADLAIAVDCGGARQLGRAQKAFFRAKSTIQIDHHDFGRAFGKITVIEHEASAVGEIVYDLIRALGVDITPSIATCLLISIVVDTGSFRFSNIRPKTFQVCGRLVRTGVQLKPLIESTYWCKTPSAMRLVGHCMVKALFSEDGRMAWSTVSQKDFRRFKAQQSDADSAADELRSVEGVKIAAVFRETPEKTYRVSFRSSDGINIGELARRFGGGGHHNSAGCAVDATVAEQQRVLEALRGLLA